MMNNTTTTVLALWLSTLSVTHAFTVLPGTSRSMLSSSLIQPYSQYNPIASGPLFAKSKNNNNKNKNEDDGDDSKKATDVNEPIDVEIEGNTIKDTEESTTTTKKKNSKNTNATTVITNTNATVASVIVNGAKVPKKSSSSSSSALKDVMREETTTPLSPRYDMEDTVRSLFQIAATTGRGEFASAVQKDHAMDLITQLESSNPTPDPTYSTLSYGTWDLVYSNTQLFRSSPFFMAGRAVCETDDQAKQYDWFCDMHRGALAISTILTVRQIISSTRLVSEFTVKAGAIPFLNDLTPFTYSGGLPITIDGTIVSSADIVPTGNGWEIYMDKVEIKGSNIPGVRQALDSGRLALSTRDVATALERTTTGTKLPPKPIFTTSFLSEDLRISRDQDGKVFVYTKISDQTEPTDFSNTMPDLGISKLLEGFNDAILKFYI